MNSSLVAGLQSDKHVKNSMTNMCKTWVRVPLPPLYDQKFSFKYFFNKYL